MPPEKTAGTLYLVATPIGNMEDITLRALRILKECDLVAAEDTRRTKKLLTHYGLSCPMVSYYEQNEAKRLPTLIQALSEGQKVALLSDAGSPGIDDPGYLLVCKAIEENIPIEAIPGPSAVIMALTLSGLPTDRFTFFGFLPRSSGARKKLLQEISTLEHTLIFFESPHRIAASMDQILAVLGNRRAALCRELTKRFEQIERGQLADIVEKLKEKKPRGEYCIVIDGTHPEAEQEAEKEERLKMARAQLKALKGYPLKEASRFVAEKYGLSRREVYQLALTLGKD